MLTRLLDILVCPHCLPQERLLSALIRQEEDGEIIEGEFVCAECGARYPVSEGLADLSPPGAAPVAAQARYDEEGAAAAYLWSHYADLWGDPEAAEAYARWGGLLDAAPGTSALDAGCATGRLTLEAAVACGFAVGVDLSRPFIKAARRLARTGRLALRLPIEGRLAEERLIELPERLRSARAEFLLADAQALPFRRGSFGAVASCNIVDKVPRPLDHLRQCQRVCASPGRLLVCDPFSWSEEVAALELWLGGTAETGRAIETIPRLLEEIPGWRAAAKAPVPWTIRHHANRFERIFSQTILALKS